MNESWQRTVPQVAGWYWRWSGNDQIEPCIVQIAAADNDPSRLIARYVDGSIQVTNAERGSWWKRLAIPDVPLSILENPCPICQEAESIKGEDWCVHCEHDFYHELDA